MDLNLGALESGGSRHSNAAEYAEHAARGPLLESRLDQYIPKGISLSFDRFLFEQFRGTFFWSACGWVGRRILSGCWLAGALEAADTARAQCPESCINSAERIVEF